MLQCVKLGLFRPEKDQKGKRVLSFRCLKNYSSLQNVLYRTMT